MAIKRVGVVGCGLMGSGIARVCAQAGFNTIVREVNQNLLDEGMDKLKSSMLKDVDKDRLSEEEMNDALDKVHGTTELKDLKDCDVVIEAIVEDVAMKEELFSELDDVCQDHTIFASNTSSLTITELASATSRTDRFVGMHFFNPVPRMPLVEIVNSLETDEEVFEKCFDFAKQLGKKPIRCKDTSGFVVNRLLVPYLLDAIRALEGGLASIEDIDKGMQLGTGHPMGPFVLLDFVGLDTTYHIANIMFDEYREKRFAPPPLLKKMVQSGLYGKKSGRGFYDYSGDKPVPTPLNF